MGAEGGGVEGGAEGGGHRRTDKNRGRDARLTRLTVTRRRFGLLTEFFGVEHIGSDSGKRF